MTAKFTCRRFTRREALRLGGTALTAGLAGCSSLPPLGSAVRYGTVDVPEATGPGGYRDWLPAPSAFPGGAEVGDEYNVHVYVPPPTDAPTWARSNISRTLVATWTDHVGVHVDDVDLALSGGDVAVLLGNVDPAAVRDALADTRYERDGSYADVDLYARSDTPRVVGVRRGALVFAGGESGRESLQAAVDAQRGDVPRYQERDGDFAALVESADVRRWGWLVPGDRGAGMGSSDDGIRSDTVGWSTSFDHDDRGVYYVEEWLFPAGYDASVRAVKSALKRRRRAVGSNAVDVGVDGRVATIEMHLPLAWADEQFDGYLTPHATFGATYEAATDRLTFHHELGDSIRTDYLSIRGDGGDSVTSFDGVGDRLEPGEDLAVSTAEFDSGATLQLVYRKPGGDSMSTLFRYELP